MSEKNQNSVLELTTSIVSSFVAKNTIASADLPDLIKTIFETVQDLSSGQQATSQTHEPAVAIPKSVTADYLICLEDGRKLKMLKRYLRSKYDMTPEDYRSKWGLPADYPMVAPNYAKLRSQHAKDIGLGKKR